MSPAGPGPGWYFDPDGRDNERYWNGEVWTEHCRSKPSRTDRLRKVNPRVRTYRKTLLKLLRPALKRGQKALAVPRRRHPCSH